MSNKGKLWLASISGGLLLSMAWWDSSLSLVMLVAFIPLLYIFDKLYHDNDHHHSAVFKRVLPAFLIFNLLIFSWLRKASPAGSAVVILENSFLMSFIFWLALLVRRRINNFIGYVALVTFWLAYEHLALNVKIISPWLNLGNTLGYQPAFIQWYEYTGIAGGTLWILLSNILLYKGLRYLKVKLKIPAAHLILTAIVIILPVLLSLYIYNSYSDKGDRSNIIIIQPNIDPYRDKFSGLPFSVQLNNMLKSVSEVDDKNYEWALLPETAVDDPFFESEAHSNRYVSIIDSFLLEYDSLNILTGITTMEAFRSESGFRKPSKRNIEGTNLYYELFNSAMQVGHGRKTWFYHKSKLVPGIEEKISGVPLFISEKIIPDLGGTMSGYGTQEDREVFHHQQTGSVVAPVICYESVFGEFLTGYIKKGAELIFIITNDGWWENTAGYKQHLMFASIRAIETRRSVARAANTGVSCFINQRGEIVIRSQWWSEEILSGTLARNQEITFYVRFGDFIYKYADIFSIILLVLTFIAIPLRKLRVTNRFFI